jgi:hypothetical protein
VSTRERFIEISQELPDVLPEELFSYIALWLKKAVRDWEEAQDDAFCRQLLDEALADPDDEMMDFDKVCEELGVRLD